MALGAHTAEPSEMDIGGIYDPSVMDNILWLIPIAFGTEKLPVYVLREDSDAALISNWHDRLPSISRQCSDICKSLVSMHLFRVGLSESSSIPTIIINTSEPLDIYEKNILQSRVSHASRQVNDSIPWMQLSFRTSTLRRSVDAQISSSMSLLPPVCRPRNCQFSRRPQTGASIGISGSLIDTATLACYLLVDRKPMVLTVDHLAPNPAKHEIITHISEQDRWDAIVPLLLEEMDRLIKRTDHSCDFCQYPFNLRNERQFHILRRFLLHQHFEGQESCPIFQELTAKNLFNEPSQCQAHPMARMVAYSGHGPRSIGGNLDRAREMDWALYEVMSDSMFWPEKLLLTHDMSTVSAPEMPKDALIVALNVKPCALVKSLGRTSGYQLGQISATASSVFQGDYFTLEWCVLKRPEAELHEWIEGGIGVDGDSGGLIVDEQINTVYGMLWARTGEGPATVTIFTPMNEILDDIRSRVDDDVVFLRGQQMQKADESEAMGLVESVPITVRIAEKDQSTSVDEQPPSPGVRRQSSAETGHPRPFERYRGGHAARQGSRQTIPRSEQDEKTESIQWPGAHTYLRYAVADDQE